MGGRGAAPVVGAPIVLALMCAALTACATGTSAAVEPDTAAHIPVTTSLEELRALQSMTIDYEGTRTNDEVAAASDAVVLGTIGEIEAGPRYGNFTDEMADMHSVVIEVRPDEYLKGGGGRESSLYVGMITGGDAEAVDAWRLALPVGLPVALYGLQSPDPATRGDSEAEIDIDAHDWGAGRPAGEPLFVPHVQGFAVEWSPGEIYWLMTGVSRSAPLAEALPGGAAVGTDQFDRLLPASTE
jgi:hypothetical protein